jgi:oligoribonuclease NrnB/cAMP/cGMP phosphodiesterase (DHH superfamily)
MKKKFLKLTDKDDTLDNLSAAYLVKTLDDVKENLTVIYKEQKGLLTYCLGSISIPANAFLKANPDYDFFIDINKKGNASFRADGKIDVALLATKLANGGGHVNASGGKFDDFKETIDYSEVKTYIQKKLDKL